MKSALLLLPILGALAYAEPLPSSTSSCACPLVKCDSSSAVSLCNCLNNRETLCHDHCPDYVPTYRPCPTSVTPPSTTSTPTPTPTADPSCTCEQVFCVQAWPQSCYCGNAAKRACWEKCGGPEPALQSCPPETTRTLQTITKVPTSTRPKPTSPPSSTHEPCGGFRGSPYLSCKEGTVCIKDPYKPGCGPECDGLGICVSEKMCGGFAGFSCPQKGMVCHDDPRDDCDPTRGGADCAGLCVWPH